MIFNLRTVLRANGFDVGRLRWQSRDVSWRSDHSIDLVPEYIGNLLLYSTDIR